jgi:hypothetical protein
MNRVRVRGVTTYHVIGGRVLSADSNLMLVELKEKTYEVIPVAGAEHKAWLLAGEKKTFAKIPIEEVVGGVVTNASFNSLTVMKGDKYYVVVADADWHSVWMEVYELEAPILA